MNIGPNVLAPPRELIASMELHYPGFFRKLAVALDAALEGVDVTVVNWFRTAEHNAAVGGQVNSQHRWACAFDLVVPLAQRAQAKTRLQAAGFWVLDEGDHLHAQAFPAGALAKSGVRPG